MKRITLTRRIITSQAAPCALAAALLLSAGCRREAPGANPPTPVRVGAVESYETSRGTRYSATISPFTQVSLAFKSGGYVDRILERRGADGRLRPLQSGDTVTRGEVLAHVKESDYADRVAQARAQLVQAQADHEHATLDFTRAKSLFSTGSNTKPQFDQAKDSFDSTDAAVRNAQAGLGQALTALHDCSIHSPVNGWVVERDIEIGTLAATGSTAFVLTDTHLVKAVFGVPDTMIGSVHLGDAQSITTSAFSGEFHGRVTSISPAADPKSRVFSVEVTIPNPGDRLKAGMIGTVTLGRGAAPQPVAVVPLSAVVASSRRENAFAVFLLDEQAGKTVVHEREVEVGETFGNSIRVLRGAKVGDRVVVLGATLVKDGQQVQVIP